MPEIDATIENLENIIAFCKHKEEHKELTPRQKEELIRFRKGLERQLKNIKEQGGARQ